MGSKDRVKCDQEGYVDIHVICCEQNCLKLRVAIVKADLDIDSDETAYYNEPERTAFEDEIEDQRPGPHPHEAHKYVVVSENYQTDANAIPGYADGFNRYEEIPADNDMPQYPPYGPITDSLFVPIILEFNPTVR